MAIIRSNNPTAGRCVEINHDNYNLLAESFTSEPSGETRITSTISRNSKYKHCNEPV